MSDNKAKGGCCLLIVIFFIGYFILWFCTRIDSIRSNEILQNQGYSQIHAHGYSWFSCSETDWSATKFSAMLNGKIIKGTVCCGLVFKNCTIRFN